MAKSSWQVPHWVVSSIVCLLLSSGITVAVLLLLGFKRGQTVYDIMAEAKAMQGKEGGAGQGPIAKGGRQGGMIEKAQNEPRPSAHIITLVEKLEALTAERGKLPLTKDQCAQLAVQLGKLTESEFLGDNLARDHMKALLSLLKDQRQTLEAAGFQWPPDEESFESQSAAYMAPGQAKPRKNPFKEGDAAKRLKALLDRLLANGS
jgi:hypothetical protein